MLGEDHSLLHEFPEYKGAIDRLAATDEAFVEQMNHYNALDKEIRVLELDGAPIADEAMNQKKHDRAMLKDSLYQRLIDAGKD